MLTIYERARIIAEPFLPLLYERTRSDLRRLVQQAGKRPFALLDVGGRRSPYTVGLPVDVTVLDLARDSNDDLGIDQTVMRRIRRHRSNVVDVRIDDMTTTNIPSHSFDGVVSVEVIEHVHADEQFAAQVARILKPSDFFYLTTPNGDYRKNEPPHYNPAHVRHYTRDGLYNLLARHFNHVQVEYACRWAQTGALAFDH
jgi:SAM-dependent methyltransferase